MPKTKTPELDYGPIWDELIAELGHPLDNLDRLSRLPRFERRLDEWDDFFGPRDFMIDDEECISPSYDPRFELSWPNVDRDERNPVEATAEFAVVVADEGETTDEEVN